MSNNTILKALERIGYKGRMTGHGFRGLASTLLHEQGYQHDHIELQLANAARNAVSAAYDNALHLKARSRLMQDAEMGQTSHLLRRNGKDLGQCFPASAGAGEQHPTWLESGRPTSRHQERRKRLPSARLRTGAG